ncbi:FixH family protein [Mycobacterium sp. ITM-2016-00316]|uniref:FixH family protein n=1 Tax=Mycobacterium sp. ITM-2016-00316 TaxID=2099695 RepID=UPI000CF86597|nr:FixH family protein [Mycobacterium sp. ITM-2016-00316]WNG84728.1 FixH family protein [Mycobacterium sp. ITM-2016-00316]
MSHQRLVVIAAIAAAVVGAGMWLLWPKSMDDGAATATAGPYRVQLTGESPKVGTTSPVTVEITGNRGQHPSPDSVTFEPAMPQMGHATTPVIATAQGDGRYRADVNLSMAGQWDITVRIAASDQVHEAVLSVTTNG